ncbi:hypothetical protein V9T40_001475 [Parthenolecanium corni]|uniref:Cytochrome P450 n=1 Tax=Parthenolecanium corni TaxID=536013 RepID=A0AAN9TKT4_9HEMI
MDHLLRQNEEGTNHTDEKVRHEINTLISAGSETNALAICFTLIMLAMNPEIQEKVYEEIVQLSEEKDTDLNIYRIQKAFYLEQCILETLRIFPPIPMLLRKVTKSFQLSDSFTVPNDSNVVIPVTIVHRNPSIYPNPLQWNPDNFTPDKVKSRHKYSFLAFSGGARDCIAMYHIVVNYLSDCKDTPRDIWIGFFHLVYVDKPDDLQVVLNHSSALQKSRLYNFFKGAVGEGLITAPEVAVGKDVDMAEKVKDHLLKAFVKLSEIFGLRVYRIWMYPIFMFKLYTSIAGYSKYFDLVHTLPKQEKVYREIVEFSGEEDRNVSIEEVQQMSYLEQCIRETLRLFPPLPFILREVTQAFQLNDNFTVQESSTVVIPIIMVHRNPNIYPNPLQWNPDNFAPNRVERRHKYSFLAFSGGARGCIGTWITEKTTTRVTVRPLVIVISKIIISAL